MAISRQEKRKKLELELNDLRAFDGNEKEIAKIEKKIQELDLQDEFEEYKKNRRKIELQILENKKLHSFIQQKGMTAEWNRYGGNYEKN